MDSAPDSSNDFSPKPGISSWMWNNIERLTTSSNFDHYGSSPPGSSGFLSNFEDMHFPHIPISGENVKSQFIVPINTIPKMTKIEDNLDSKKKQSKPRPQCPDPNFPKSFSSGTLSKHVAENFTGMIPSEDSTPMYTPEGSPMVLRRTPLADLEGLCGPKLQERVEKKRAAAFISSASDISDNLKHKANMGPVNYRKYAVSNFDMNVVSPISW